MRRRARWPACPGPYSVRATSDDLEDLELVADLEVVEVLERQAALEAGLDLAHVVLEALERVELAVVDHDVVAQHAHLAQLRRTTPSVTKQPATVPTFEILKTWRTSTMPRTFSFFSGASMPDSAAFTSSTAS